MNNLNLRGGYLVSCLIEYFCDQEIDKMHEWEIDFEKCEK